MEFAATHVLTSPPVTANPNCLMVACSKFFDDVKSQQYQTGEPIICSGCKAYLNSISHVAAKTKNLRPLSWPENQQQTLKQQRTILGCSLLKVWQFWQSHWDWLHFSGIDIQEADCQAEAWCFSCWWFSCLSSGQSRLFGVYTSFGFLMMLISKLTIWDNQCNMKKRLNRFF